MSHRIVRTTAGPDRETLAALGRLGVSTVHEAMGRRGLVEPVLKPIYPGARIAGRAVTVLSHPGDNLMIHAAIEQCGEGDVLVVTTTSPSTDGMFGDLFATALMARGTVGLIINAGVRDVADLTAMGFPVWSKAVHSQGTNKLNPGSINVPIMLPGISVLPGDAVVADDDGVLIVPLAEAADAAVKAQRRQDNEAEKREQFRAGILGLDLYDLRPKLKELGVEYVDQ
ncbi:4-carboxy-4-hydroxy-2-oxoadipate aldolase/oxaloacetate decarboxylase [Arthrobacter gengyunqii]|uniref:Putative 4-hydroxy-4-methyl-2-oxoglutarate aldolase n=1 Tax=Arthrobacter gengyunqii TaxID=2886940 RepID=A0A9X1M4K4_9MICC|nr:4-carboxy-4-hydroxy-2-oxoadipate aldolase/oxaloacetate decarboxylase [Arthrobacter gengyunqii]MCC3270184.1 4-carboxy-4-hydroxy-2-oxoadipate aldolase/oxaloacetate decarboxylase [Arthrobacter gengyunqii]UOY96889.1 4-carboxy-4-hydroxy-2-oxoadipate aldolase/oxaloacetate decarboxylase [Arthrobacter gengyunqii]